MYEFMIRCAAYIRELFAFLWASIGSFIGFFAPGHPGFPLVIAGAAVIIGKYSCRFLQRRNYYRAARIVLRTVQGFAVLVMCFVAFEVVLAVYPLVVKAVGAFK